MWTYKSPVGIMRISRSGQKYYLEINGEYYGSYSSPKNAADDVASFVTGCYEWDSLAEVNSDYPADLSEWKASL